MKQEYDISYISNHDFYLIFWTHKYEYTMRTIATIIVSLMTTAATHGQTKLTQTTNAFTGTGRLVMQQVWCDESDQDSLFWDFSQMETMTPKYIVWHLDRSDSLRQMTAVMERGTRHTYCQQGDSLLISCYRSRLSEVSYDEREIYLLLPMAAGDSVYGYFHGRGTYGDKAALRQYGRYWTKAVGTGTLLLPGSTSMDNVLRLHTERLVSCRLYPITLLDSLLPYTTDSVRASLMTDTAVYTVHADRWYAPGYRYPVLEKRIVFTDDGSPEISQTLYYPAENQVADHPDDGANAAIRALMADRHEQKEEAPSSNADPDEAASFLRNIRTSTNGSTVSVSYDVLKDATVTASMCNVSGIVCRRQSQTGRAGESCRMTIRCDGLRKGQYVLYLNVNGQVTSHTVTL